eukprot:CAMPEP_0206152328 /NCGR_PEP_ID=MMETSP1473-20131121/39269_1 /ASSEMBLY_ACC=CAM_ASM_001109 /TAXON_ID=1461547 /ORGANISM="Stichococcus sp, Strain RCC1054" /LENGTH=67 /DNA_ID=CAMNT_0053549887 /DNA_START=937 /DNA_END=1140 /DNA_ORIENTATION=-
MMETALLVPLGQLFHVAICQSLPVPHLELPSQFSASLATTLKTACKTKIAAKAASRLDLLASAAPSL